jgi:hypothetical protein
MDGTGGHTHTSGIPRPVGDFFLRSEDSQVEGRGPNFMGIAVTTDSDGVAEAIYRSSGVAGRERIIATVTPDVPSQGPDTNELVIKVSGLVEMASAVAGTYSFKSQIGSPHGDNNHWVLPSFRDSVLAVFRALYADGGVIEDPESGNRFLITDAGLEWGGLYDLYDETEWSSPHMTHRLGRDMDVRSDVPGGSPVLDARSYALLQTECIGTEDDGDERVLRCTQEPPPKGNPRHFHFEALNVP